MNTTRCIVCAIVVATQGTIWATLQLREMHAGINVETKIMHKSGMGLTGVIHDLETMGSRIGHKTEDRHRLPKSQMYQKQALEPEGPLQLKQQAISHDRRQWQQERR